MNNLADKKYLFRERAVRAILKEWKERKGLIVVKPLTKRYNLPYFNTLNFLKRLAKDNVIKWRKVPLMIKHQLEFELTPYGERRLQEELLYASSI